MDDTLKPITEIAQRLGLAPADLIPYGHFKAKIPLSVVYSQPRRAKMVLVTATNPTPKGEGKTTVSIGLAEALNRRGHAATVVLREPSLGPVFGLKGGATGGGKSQVLPSTDINLHFNGDFHAITAAHNLLAALIDNEIFHGARLSLKPSDISYKRVLDVNDRALRQIVTGLGRGNGIVRETGFDITAASEVMAVLALSKDLADLTTRLGRMVIAHGPSAPTTVDHLGAAMAMTALLTDAIMPNLVQTTEHTPAIIHAGPFANIAHGCNSVLATEAGLRHSDIVVTEAGFGADLGAEKFLDIKSAVTERPPDAAVIVTTLRSLRYQGSLDPNRSSRQQLEFGAANLEKHVENLSRFGIPHVVALNHFSDDDPNAVEWLKNHFAKRQVEIVAAPVFQEGGQGGLALAEAVEQLLGRPAQFVPLYSKALPLKEKILRIAQDIYGADGVTYDTVATKKLSRYTKWGDGDLAVCMAKTQYSLSDNPQLLGRPEHFTVHIRDVEIARGAGYIVPLAGNMVRMPGLPKDPAAFSVHVGEDGQVEGVQ